MPFSNEFFMSEADLIDHDSFHTGFFENAFPFPTDTEQQLTFSAGNDPVYSYTNSPASVFGGSAIFAGITDVAGNEVGSLCPPDVISGLPDAADSDSHFYNLEAGETGLETLPGHMKDPETDSYRPPAPCNYCRIHRLQCLVIRTTTANPNPRSACSSCVALFRDCSLAEKAKRHPCQYETVSPVIGNLHGINETTTLSVNTSQDLPKQTDHPQGLRPCSEPRVRQLAHSKRASSRMKGRTKPLRLWFFHHLDNPFPSEEEKLELQNESGLTRIQVQNWFTNARRRQKAYDQPQGRQIYPLGSPMPQSAFSDLTPFQRWRNSPPEDDHVSLELVKQASNVPFGSGWPSCGNSCNDQPGLPSYYDGFSSAANSASSDSMSSFETFASVDSHGSNHCSSRSFETGTLSTENVTIASRFTYQCTFCKSSFKKKSDWSRHETSIHIQLNLWICQYQEPIIWQVGCLQPQCNYCGMEQPSQAHFDSHDFQACAERPFTDRAFRRKDHLWQHLQKFHGCRGWPGQNLQMRRCHQTTLASRCGFCSAVFFTWSERESHLARHFRDGWQMNQWIGDWGFDEETALLLNRATLPGNDLSVVTEPLPKAPSLWNDL